MSWRTIDSAPIGWDSEHEVDLWIVQSCNHAGRITDCRARLVNDKPQWHARSEEGWTRLYGTATHWMPRPDPPEAA